MYQCLIQQCWYWIQRCWTNGATSSGFGEEKRREEKRREEKRRTEKRREERRREEKILVCFSIVACVFCCSNQFNVHVLPPAYSPPHSPSPNHQYPPSPLLRAASLHSNVRPKFDARPRSMSGPRRPAPKYARRCAGQNQGSWRSCNA